MNAKIFGATLASLRKKKGYTQADLAEMLGLSNKTVSKWENGKGYPDIVVLPMLAKLLDVTVDDMLSEKKRVLTVTNLINDEISMQLELADGWKAVRAESIENAVKLSNGVLLR